MKKKRKKVIFEFDDLHFLEPENCLSMIDIMVNMYPKIKLSFFTIPYLKDKAIYENKEFCFRLLDHINNNNVRLGIHGLQHTTEEFKNLTYGDALEKLMNAEDVMQLAELPYAMAFKGPHWGINEETIVALKALRFTHLYNHTDYWHLDKVALDNGLKVEYYNWNLKDEFKEKNVQIYIAHGHTHNVCGNGIEESMERMVRFIDREDPEFLFIDET